MGSWGMVIIAVVVGFVVARKFPALAAGYI